MADVTLDVEADDQTSGGFAQARSSVTSFGKAALGAFTGVGLAIGAAFSVDKITDFFNSAIERVRELEEIEGRITGLVNASGQAAGFSTEQLDAMARGLDSVNQSGLAAAKGVQAAVLNSGNLRGDVFTRTAQAAFDMAAAMGDDAPNAAKELAKAINDPLKGMEQLAEKGIIFSESQKKVIEDLVASGNAYDAQVVILDELEKKYHGVSEASITSADRTEHSWSNVQEIFGRALTPAIDAVIGKFLEFEPVIIRGAEVLSGWIKAGADWSVKFVDLVKEGVDESIDIFADFLAVVDTVWDNFGKIVERALLQYALNIETSAQDTKHLFTEVIPAYLDWFGENWDNILSDIVDRWSAAFTNMWTNLENFFKNVKAWLSGDATDWKWVNLEEGFESSLTALPEIAERHRTELEKQLGTQIKKIDDGLLESFIGKAETYKAALRGMLGGGTGDVSGETLGIQPGAFSKDLTVTQKTDAEKNAKEKSDKEAKGETDKADTSTAEGELVGLAELANRISAGSAKSAQEATKDAVEKVGTDQIEKVKEVKKAVEDGLAKTNEYLGDVVDYFKRGGKLLMGD